MTSYGRAFAAPITLAANTHGQLGIRRVRLSSQQKDGIGEGELMATLSPIALEYSPPPKAPPILPLPQHLQLPGASAPDESASRAIPRDPESDSRSAPESDVRFCTTLHEIPALKNLHIVELVAGDRHSLARTREGRVLAFGANHYG